MNKLAIQLPGFSPIPQPSGLKPEFVNIASIVSGLLNIALLLAAFLAFYWLVWGAFEYILAKGDKEGLAKARARISWAIVGLLITVSAYLIATFAGEIFPATRGGLPF